MITPGAQTRLRRRTFLQLALAGSASGALAACAPSPLISPDETPHVQPTLDDARRQTAQATADLIALADGCAAIPGADPAFVSWCSALSAQHGAHLTVLCQADPLGGVLADPTPIEEITAGELAIPGSQAEAAGALAAQETALADLISALPTSAVGADADAGLAGSMALLWISQLLCAQLAAQVLGSGDGSAFNRPVPVAGDAVPAKTEMGDLGAAEQVLLSQQRALVFGLQALYGRVDYLDPTADLLAARLGEAMRERDAVAATIVASEATPEPQPPEYTMPGDVTDATQTALIWGALEVNVMNAWARLGAVDASSRTQAVQQGMAQAGRAGDRGVALSYWPGWV
ncbi:DUF4439 domain-containing protein [Brooklawnia sp.]|uniref:DUF4439 domain-containing protein n=1 Tax=Brooklawnia sp. TaxID=2699740 RepID=UPI00311E450D